MAIAVTLPLAVLLIYFAFRNFFRSYWITPEDLAAKRFENTVLTIEAYGPSCFTTARALSSAQKIRTRL